MRSKFSRLCCSVLATAVLALPTFVSAAEGDYSGEVFQIGVGARALGMGGAFVGAASDATAAYWNPAGLSLIDNVEIATIHATKSAIQSYDFFNVAFNAGKTGAFAISYIRLAVDGIIVTGPSGPEQLATTSWVDQAALLSGGWRFKKKFAIGTTIKFLKTDGYTSTGTGFGADLGLMYKASRKLGIGLVARDFTGGSYYKWKGTITNPSFKVKPNFKIGLAYTTEMGKRVDAAGGKIPASTLSVNFDMDTLYISKSLNTYHAGAEYWYRQFVALRGGIQTNGFKFDKDNLFPSAGVGVWLYLFEIDYAFVKYNISNTHYFSTITRF